MSVEHEQNHPVLIIGAGLAGLTVALHLADQQPVILMANCRRA
jgi:L-aspartate oxidase